MFTFLGLFIDLGFGHALHTGDMRCCFKILGSDGDLVACVGLESSQSVPKHTGLHDFHLNIVDADRVHEVGVRRDPRDGARGASRTSWLHTCGKETDKFIVC